jgi:hypothetical protein
MNLKNGEWEICETSRNKVEVGALTLATDKK